MLTGVLRSPGPLIGTMVAAATAATLATAAISIVASNTQQPAGRLADASVVVAGRTSITVGDTTLALPAYRGVPVTLAQQLSHVPGVATAKAESGFPNGVVAPGDADLIAVTAKPGVSPDTLAQRIRADLPKSGQYTIATGAKRGDVANLNAAVERGNGVGFSAALIPAIISISLFVLAATTALAVNLRRQRYTRLRLAGATRGQVRRTILAELGLCGVAGGVLAFLPGMGLGALGARAMASHGILPPGSTAWHTPWLLLIACGMSLIVVELSGQIAARRASRSSPAQAFRENSAERKWPNPVRVLLGLAAAGGSGALMVVTLREKSPAGQLALAFPLLLACMVAVALLGPLLVALVAWLARPAQSAGGPSARLALAAVSAQPRRTASAVIPVAMAVALIGTVYFANTSIAHATSTQAGTLVTADHEISGSGLTAGTLARIQQQNGVRAAAGVAPVTLAATDPDLEQVYGEAVAGGPVSQLLDLGVTAGSLTTLRPGQIAVSALEASSGQMGVHLGSRVTVYLPDGTPYPGTVSAIYSHSLATGDVLIPAAVTAGHTGAAPSFSQILVNGSTPPGLHAVSRNVANAQSEQAAATDGFGNDMILGVVAILCAVALLNTLVISTLERRRAVRLLGRVGATRGQIAAVFGWQALFVTITGLVAGLAAGAVTLFTVTRAATGSWTPYLPPSAAIGLVAAVAALTVAGIMIPYQAISRHA